MNKLAIVIPYYKIDFFEETLQSVAAQTNKNFTLYIGNDASPNSPLPLIQKYFKESDYKYFYYEENLGGKNLAMQWERILENVNEEWFQILGDDDMIADNFVHEFHSIIQTLVSENASVLRVNRFTVDDHNKLISEDLLKEGLLKSTDLFEMGYYGKTTTSLSEFIFRLGDYHQFKFDKIPLAWGTDVLAFLKFSGFRNIFINNNSFVNVKVTTKSITGNSSDLLQVKEDAFNVFREIILNQYSKHFKKKFIDKLVRDYLEYCWKTHKKPHLNLASIFLKKMDFLSFIKKNITLFKINNRNKKFNDGR